STRFDPRSRKRRQRADDDCVPRRILRFRCPNRIPTTPSKLNVAGSGTSVPSDDPGAMGVLPKFAAMWLKSSAFTLPSKLKSPKPQLAPVEPKLFDSNVKSPLVTAPSRFVSP